jgi:hypothetical protein
VDNFRDDGIQATITPLETPADSTSSPDTLTLNAFDIRSYHAQKPGRYRVDFHTVNGGADLGTCTLGIKSGDQYQFVALPERTVVNRANRPASIGTDFVIQTSTLCR